MKQILFICIIAFSLPTFSANVCGNLSGDWQGDWEDETHGNQTAQIQVNPLQKNKFTGTFYLANGSTGKVDGKCNAVNLNEAELFLKKDKPYFNPCRGTLIQLQHQDYLHIFCFNPNQSGYFKR